MAWTLDREGFVTHWLVSGPLVEKFHSELRDPNQLRYEATLRAKSVRHELIPQEHMREIREGQRSRLGLPWRFIGGRDQTLINLSDFYPQMRLVRFDAAVTLTVPEDREIRATVWSYAAVDVWCNGERVGMIREPVYKPIQHTKLMLPLRQGENLIYLSCETLGVRDTRSVFALQIESSQTPQITVGLPDQVFAEQAERALTYLEAVQLGEKALLLPAPAPKSLEWACIHHEVDFAKAHRQPVWHTAEGERQIRLPEREQNLTVRLRVGEGYLSREFERTELILPQRITPTPSLEENQQLIWRRIAAVSSLSRGERFGFPIANMLARKFLGQESPEDAALMQDMLTLIDERVDCSDFLVVGLLRYLKCYPVEPKVRARIREVLLGFRYWMDQDGFDGMCFWSENHCLMFYTSAMGAGELYPDDWFPLAKRTGRELYAWGRSKVLEWLEDVEQNGYEEFLSGVYTCVTFVALLHLVDFAEPEISRRVTKLTDKLITELALHVFKGGLIAPQGRVYRGVLYPFSAGAMALINIADPSQPWSYGEGWLSFAATSRYRMPESVATLIRDPVSTVYQTGNAEIVLEKREDWCLTSVRSPRESFLRWENAALNPDADPSSHAFVKGYNECFHGTTDFQPGVYGYQQHLWYAALDGAAILFVNHPGSSTEGGDMRPGYWHGNGVMPALQQQENVLGMIYRIPEEHPFHYIHLYCPECRFEEVTQKDDWLIVRKGSGWIGFWSSVPMSPWEGEVSRCERRMWGDEIACVCVCGGREYPDRESFLSYLKTLQPCYMQDTLTAGALQVVWKPGKDRTQYL